MTEPAQMVVCVPLKVTNSRNLKRAICSRGNWSFCRHQQSTHRQKSCWEKETASNYTFKNKYEKKDGVERAKKQYEKKNIILTINLLLYQV